MRTNLPADWLGWIGDDMDATIGFGKTEIFTQVKMHTLDQNNSWIYLPKYVEVLVSKDGKKFTSVSKESTFIKDTLTSGFISINFPVQRPGI